MEVNGNGQCRPWINTSHSHASSGTGTGGVDVIEDTPIIDPPIQAQRSNYRCCGFGCHCSYYRIPTLHELYQREKRLLRAIVIIVTFLNIPFGNFILYPFQLFSTWIHESFHGLAGTNFLECVYDNYFCRNCIIISDP